MLWYWEMSLEVALDQEIEVGLILYEDNPQQSQANLVKRQMVNYCTHSKLRPPPFLLDRFSYKYGGGAYNWIMVISLGYTTFPG